MFMYPVGATSTLARQRFLEQNKEDHRGRKLLITREGKVAQEKESFLMHLNFQAKNFKFPRELDTPD